MEHLESEQDAFDTAQVALALLAILHLQFRFSQSTSNAEKTTLLTAAAEVLDRTVPSAELKAQLKGASPEEALRKLMHFRKEIALVPTGLWHKPRVTPNDLGPAHYAAWRALERLQRSTRTGSSSEERTRAAQVVLAWLAETAQQHPALLTEASYLAEDLSAKAT